MFGVQLRASITYAEMPTNRPPGLAVDDEILGRCPVARWWDCDRNIFSHDGILVACICGGNCLLEIAVGNLGMVFVHATADEKSC